MRRLPLSARWVCQECGTSSARRYDFSVAIGKLGFYMKSHNFMVSLKFAKAVCQTGPASTNLQVLPCGTVSSLRAWKESHSLVYTQNPAQGLAHNTFSLNFG